MGTTKQSILASDTQLAAGMQKDLGGNGPLMVAGQSVTPAQAITVLQGRIASANAVIAAKAVYQKAVAAHTAQMAQTKPFVTALRQLLLAMFLTQTDKLADLGLTPRKTVSRTVVEKVVAAAKNLATRKERGTVGSSKKKLIKGAVGPTLSISTTPGTSLTVSTGEAGSAAAAAPPSPSLPPANGTPPGH
jgi:hypothetical protein